MTKSEFVYRVAEKTGLTRRDAERAADAVFEAIQEAMMQGEKVQVPGFGAFKSRRRAAFTGRNPKTGEPMPIPETVVPVFEASRQFKEKMKG